MKLRVEVTALQNVIALLNTENQRLSSELEITYNQLEDEVSLFQTILLQWFDEKSRKIVDLEQTMETIFQDLVDDFGDKTNFVDDLVKEMKSLSHENASSKTDNARLNIS
jgi:hypothetical protein